MTNAFKTYLQSLQTDLARGNASEHTHRPTLKTLLESLGERLTATNEPRHVTDCGKPDMAVYQGPVLLGYLETKDVGVNLAAEEKGPQLKRYREALPNLILTDYLEFRWYVNGERRLVVSLGHIEPDGKVRAKKEDLAAVGDLLAQFLALKLPSIGTAKELALRMANLAGLMHHAALRTLEIELETGTLKGWLAAFERTLVPSLSPEQFSDMYAQTLTYGLFAAKVSVGAGQELRRDTAAGLLPETNPFLKRLFYHLAGPEVPPTVSWVVDDMVALLNSADLEAVMSDFGRGSLEKDPVVHFYETFLAAYDPEKRKVRGVYYTPEPVVSYIVRAIDFLLKDRFGRPWGIADKDTLILDPACGTGTFLHSVISLIYDTLSAQGQAGGWPSYVSQSLLPRIFGFELLMAPYSVAHLKLGLLLQEKGFDFPPGQRLGVYLTNTLDEGFKKAEVLPLAGFITEESNSAARIKKEDPIEVILGNPPYAGHSANASLKQETGVTGTLRTVRTFIGRLIEDYKQVDGKPLGEKNPKWLQDDYVKFLRWGQWRLSQTGRGVLAMITNHGYLDNPTFRGMRQQLMQTFSEIYLLNLHGNAKKKEICPDGSKDENVFDIQQGVAIGIFIKQVAQAPSPVQADSAQPGAAGPQMPLAKPAQSEYRRNLPHLQAAGRPVFVTFRTWKNFVLPESVRDVVLKHCLHDHKVKLWMHAAVVMPDHVHLLFTPLEDARGNSFGLAEIMHGIKGTSAHAVNKALQRRGHVWQDESFDHLLRSSEKTQEKAEYICQNPVRQGLVTDAATYLWLWREWQVAQAPSPVQADSAQPRAAGPHQKAAVYSADLWGTREGKYQALAEMDMDNTPWRELQPRSPYYLFVPQDKDLRAEYDQGWPVNEIFPVSSVGIVTARDSLTIHWTRQEVMDTVKDFAALDPEKAREKYHLGKDARDWKIELAQKDLKVSGLMEQLITPVLYRPFDVRYTYYTGRTRGFICMPRPDVMGHMLAGENVALCFHRREELAGVYSHFLATRYITEHGLLSSKTTNCQAPLFLYPRKTYRNSHKSQNSLQSLYEPEAPYGREINLKPEFLNELAGVLGMRFIANSPSDLQTTFGPEDVFSYTYSVFHSPTYRQRYSEFLKVDFPRLPLTGNKALFKALVGLGVELVSIHLMESPRLENLLTRFPISGSQMVEKVSYQEDKRRLYINAEQYFEGIPPEVWAFTIGGYQVCHKWLKDRKGRTLTFEDLHHYQKIVVALAETIRIMKEIDAIIEAHGGWPLG